jgi:hypothetical protein
MNETFEIPLTYKGKEVTFPSKLIIYGYSYKIQGDVYGTEVLYEPDEERNYRATVNPDELESKKIDVELLKAIADTLEAIVK